MPNDFSFIAREFSREVIDSIDILNIYLFGSVAKGTYRKDSDIDLAVIAEEKTPKQDMIVNAICDKLSKRFHKKIQCFLMTQNQLTKKNDLSEEILKHGIKLI